MAVKPTTRDLEGAEMYLAGRIIEQTRELLKCPAKSVAYGNAVLALRVLFGEHDRAVARRGNMETETRKP